MLDINKIIMYNKNGTVTETEYNAFEQPIKITAVQSKTINGERATHIWNGNNIAADKRGNQTTIYARGIGLCG